jgi:hypothetical protein
MYNLEYYTILHLSFKILWFYTLLHENAEVVQQHLLTATSTVHVVIIPTPSTLKLCIGVTHP